MTISLTAVTAACVSTGSAMVAPPVVDPAYGISGQASAGFTNVAGVDAETDAAGRRVVLGQAVTEDGDRAGEPVWLVRFTGTGATDGGFGPLGRVAVTMPVDTVVRDLAVGGDGRFWITGEAGRSIVVARLTTAGVPDPTFGSNGVAIHDTGLADAFSSFGVAAAALTSADGIVIAAGAFTETEVQRHANLVVRLTTAGAPDPAFGSSGRAVLPAGLDAAPATLRDVAHLSSGQTAVSFSRLLEGDDGEPHQSNGVLRLDSDGTPDTDFGDDGIATLVDDSAGAFGVPDTVIEDGTGALVVAGTAAGLSLARVRPDGDLDQSFGDGGISVVANDGCSSGIAELAVDPQGRYWVHGTRGCGISAAEFARFTADGQPDSSFGVGGYRSLYHSGFASSAVPIGINGRSLWFDGHAGAVFGLTVVVHGESVDTVDLASWRLLVGAAR